MPFRKKQQKLSEKLSQKILAICITDKCKELIYQHERDNYLNFKIS